MSRNVQKIKGIDGKKYVIVRIWIIKSNLRRIEVIGFSIKWKKRVIRLSFEKYLKTWKKIFDDADE